MGAVLVIGYPLFMGALAASIYGILSLEHKSNERSLTEKDVQHTGVTLALVNGFMSWGEDSAIALTWNGGEPTTNKDIEEVLVPITSDDKAVFHHWNDTLPQWISVKNRGASPVCLAGVSIQKDDTVMTLAGDLGRVCGAEYYESSRFVLPEDQHTQAPSCTWIDANHPIRFNLAGNDNNDNDDNNVVRDPTDLCKAPFMTWAPSDKGAGAGNQQRGIEDASPFDGILVKSSRPLSSAVRLCNSVMAKGPSFVSEPEELYCDMTTKTLYPVCKEGTQGICFDDNEDELIDNDAPPEIRQRGFDAAPKSLEKTRVLKAFRDVRKWS
ncbi:hypothetical protein PV08_09296 [Exophiala spinifera]|uniref:Uncharacterized protein n=1 Tax=Exophiala spinifera TaxID=91928 RepID=A0A0D1ZGD9_9EURO|nr:uncharacterized protein PV08_09296 [Exophiala spinifera]KIW12022.1 hypothetical protein PV08_09296 [Exophiala spinifera]